ncbi:unnamed protein product (macronuclear) [Paramecium tetraurelia]|uniref:Uncharacterized protein n=1 Tax=Paramecium tetraurelia TaxID=5888 RepID=A0DUY6_PARTE|nr:uncharacterized protein GSPATT00020515001 [Paramecium tetraurelia]CAK86853.1 unnamed protein product [Paramecium tetraurelia]|eukprot:XP_001454250.1 hypothetical protein (macronuclear) [Paramecium tetraurelia strain d4-2]
MKKVGLLCLEHQVYPKLICFDQSCKASRFQCMQCIKQGAHVSHPQNQEDPQQIYQHILKIETESEALIKYLQLSINDVNKHLQFLINGIRRKYQKKSNEIQKMEYKQVHFFFSQTIKFKSFEETLKIQYQKSFQDFIDSLENLYLDLKLPQLDYITFYSQDMVRKPLTLAYELYQDYDDYQEAIQLFDKSLQYITAFETSKIWGKGKIMCQSLADSLRILNKPDEAIIWADKALQIDQNHCQSLWSKAESLRILCKYDESIIWADKCLLINPKDNLSLFCKVLAQCLQMLGKYNETIILVDKVLQSIPKHLDAYCTKSDSLRQLQMFREAMDAIELSLSIDPNHIESLMVKGQCLQDQKQYQEALNVYENALEINPNHQQSKEKKAECLEALNQI